MAWDDWLAIWDTATELERAVLVERVAKAASSAYDAVLASGALGRLAPTPHVISARRDKARFTATFAWSHAVQVGDAIEQTLGVDRVSVRSNNVSAASPILRRTHRTTGHDVEAYLRTSLDELRACLVASDHVERRLQGECDREVARGMASCVRPVAMQVIDTERRGARLVVTTCGWYRLYFQSISGSDWSVRYIAVDEVGVEGDLVMGERTLASVEGGMTEGESDDYALADKLDADHVAEVIAMFRNRDARIG